MFYSHEILTSRKYGVATVWLVATLGPRSTLKRLNRKAILDVNVPKACQTIVAPEAPMALRLQGNLLYGVSRVYSQQCGYILSDVQQAHHNLVALRRTLAISELDPRAGKARPEQLMMSDDPAFIPELVLPEFDTDILASDLQSSLPLPSPEGARGTRAATTAAAAGYQGYQSTPLAAAAPIGLVLPSSDIDAGAPLGDFGLPETGLESAQRSAAGAYPGPAYGEQEGLLPEVDFEFDAEGNLRNIGTSAISGAAAEVALPRLASDSAASARVRREHVEGFRAMRDLSDPIDVFRDTGTGTEYDLPAALPFEPAAPAAQVAAALPELQPEEVPLAMEEEEQLLPDLPDTPRARRSRGRRIIAPDAVTELRHSDLARWNSNYAANMALLTRYRQNRQRQGMAKQNAAFWVYGAGIGNIGASMSAGMGVSSVNAALGAFVGASLLALLPAEEGPPASPKRKAPGEGSRSPDSEERRVRMRTEAEDQAGRADQTMHHDEQQDINLGFGDQDIELGREAAPALPEGSSAMPWNITASVRGSSIARGRGAMPAGLLAGSSVARASSQLRRESNLPPSRRISRFASSSPLVGRGMPLEGFSSLGIEGEGAVTAAGAAGAGAAGASRIVGPHGAGGGDGGGSAPLAGDDLEALMEFQLGQPSSTAAEPGEFVPQQLLSPTQQVAAAAADAAAAAAHDEEDMRQDSLQFLAFLRAYIEESQPEPAAEEAAAAAATTAAAAPRKTDALFHELLPPTEHTKVVAAQAFHHSLVLATRSLITVQQARPFGDIRLAPVSSI